MCPQNIDIFLKKGYLQNDATEQDYSLVSFFIRKIIDDLAVLKCGELGVELASDSDAMNYIFCRSLKSKKFKKILNEINEFAPLIAKNRLEVQAD